MGVWRLGSILVITMMRSFPIKILVSGKLPRKSQRETLEGWEGQKTQGKRIPLQVYYLLLSFLSM